MPTTRKRARSPTHTLSSSVPAGALDLSAVARQAVLGFLQDASIATAERQAAARVAAAPADAASAVVATENTVFATESMGSLIATESSAWQAATISVNALDRIEAAAAKVEADIAAAAQAHSEIQAGVGTAVEEAVRAAQSAAGSADTAVQADRRVSVIMRRIEHYTAITVGLLIVAIILLSIISV
jgi:hypothetical protein